MQVFVQTKRRIAIERLKTQLSLHRSVIARYFGLLCLACDIGLLSFAAESQAGELDGAAIYAVKCAACHGPAGQGVPSKYADALVGDQSIGQLADLISRTMPEDAPESCVGEEARAVAEYMHQAFYSEAAQVRNRPPQTIVGRLTAEQLRQSTADLYAIHFGYPERTDDRGLWAQYYSGKDEKPENRKVERVDDQVQFDFGRDAPADGVNAEEFVINWSGGLRVDVTGEYELIVRSTCSFVCDFGRERQVLFDNHVQSGDKTEFRERLMLVGGRVYPFELRFTQRDRKTESPPAKVQVAWKTPWGVEQTIPKSSWVPKRGPGTFALQTRLPPDDRSYGFERGIAINREWDESTTSAALEFAQAGVDDMLRRNERRRRNSDSPTGDNRVELRETATKIIEGAFRTRLTEEEKQRYIGQTLLREPDDAEALRRILVQTIKSPRFLFPLADVGQSLSQRRANRIALYLFDSIPTGDNIQQEIASDKLDSDEVIRNLISQSIVDYRTQAKVRQFLYEWLNLNRAIDVSKDESEFPGFDDSLASDLRDSLDAHLDAVVWSESSDYRDLFDSDFYFTTPRIAAFYEQMPLDPSDSTSTSGVQLIRVPYSTYPYGVVTHPLVLSRLAYRNTTSPIHRGIFLLNNLLGRSLKPPQEAFAPLSPSLHPDLTTRERVALQTSPANCQTCHIGINGLGFTLESFDAVGRSRRTERGKPIDVSGHYTSRNGARVDFADTKDVIQFLVESEDAQRSFVTRAFHHFVKQPPAAFGIDTTERLLQAFRKSNFNIRELIAEIVFVAAVNDPDCLPSTHADPSSSAALN